MAYKRKTKDRWDIETNWGTGWETEDCEYTRIEAKQRYKEYAEAYRGQCAVRLVKKREKITANSDN